MDKYEYNLKFDQIKSLCSEENYDAAADVADTINWSKIRNVNALVKAAEVYENVGRYDEAHNILLMAYDRSPIGRMIIYRLAELAIKRNNLEEANDYYEEFVGIAPRDNLKYVLLYKILKAKGASYMELIAVLEKLKEQEYTEEWSYELAYLYHKANMVEKCIEACDELILWFGDGPYVERALELKMLYQPLTKSQEEKYRSFRLAREGITRIHAEEMEKAGEYGHSSVNIPQVTLSSERFNTINLQEEIAKGMQQIMNATEKETVNDTMDSIRKAVEEIPYLTLPKEPSEPTTKEQEHIETDEEIDGSLKINFQELLGEDSDGQISMMVDEQQQLERQITGQMTIADVLEEWEKTKHAAEVAMKEADERKLKSAKARALQEAGDIMERLTGLIPQLDAGVQPVELLENEYMRHATEKQEEPSSPSGFAAGLAAGAGLAAAVGTAEAVKAAAEQLGGVTAEEASMINDTVTGAVTGLNQVESQDIHELKPIENTLENAAEETAEVEEPIKVAETVDLEPVVAEEPQVAVETVSEPAMEEEPQEVVEAAEAVEEEPQVSLEAVETEPVEEEELKEAKTTEEEVDEISAALENSIDRAMKQDTKEMYNAKMEDILNQPTIRMPSVKLPKGVLPSLKKGDTLPDISIPDELLGDLASKAARERAEREREQNTTHKLTDEQKAVFSYFVPVKGMEQQLSIALEGIGRHLKEDVASNTGNLVIQGGRGCGKTVLATSIIKVLQKDTGKLEGKVGKINAEALNRKDIQALLQKVKGGVLIIEQAGDLERETAVKLALMMSNDTNGTLIIMEDTTKGIKKALSQDAAFASLFTEKVTVPNFTNDELVSFAKSYSSELGYEIDEMAILALYNRISNIQRLDQATTLIEVKDIVDEAIEREQHGGLKKAFSIITASRYTDDDKIVLKERVFE